MARRTTGVLGCLLLAAALGAPAVGHAAPATTSVQRATVSKPLVTRLRGVHNARQVISVTTARYGSDQATVRAFTKTAKGWKQTAGPWTAWIGRDGFAPPGDKREGDGRTPSGSYLFSYMFGVDANPGVHYRWRHAGRSDVWDDDSSSARYNLWVNETKHSPGSDPEPLHVQPSYDDVAVIAYNTARTPHLGSAIFLHVTHHSATSGCVALPRPELLKLLRWLRPADHARIIMGRTATVTRQRQ